VILFLDFDGVLHPIGQPAALFMWVPRVASWLSHWPGVDVVISSSWRTAHDQSELVEMIGGIGDRVVGVTPVLALKQADETGMDGSATRALRYGRQDETLQWMADSWEPQRYCVALDDMSFLFEPGCERLVLRHSNGGVSLEDLDRLSVHAVKAGLGPASRGP